MMFPFKHVKEDRARDPGMTLCVSGETNHGGHTVELESDCVAHVCSDAPTHKDNIYLDEARISATQTVAATPPGCVCSLLTGKSVAK
jgi:hypothetical protein